jgi:glycosyltransferase involved in cell wall biosynthesis
MRIAQVAPLAESVPPEGYGGTERVVSYLTEELVRLGHDVTLFATADSETSAELEPMSPRAARSDPPLDARPFETRMVAEAYRRSGEFDVIHCHTDYVGLPLSEHAATPTVVTLHGRLDVPGLRAVFREFPNVAYVSISDNQRTAAPDMNWVATIYHGLPASLYSFQPTPGDYLLFLGRICAEKGTDRAIRIATRAGMPLRIAAKVDQADQEYFESAVQPLLDDPRIDFLGEVGGERKLELLANARALLFPIDWPEPFGLVMIEALACGTPVIARRCGSVPEILRDGQTGFVCETDDEMCEAVSRLGHIDRRRCRSDFESRFTDTRMTEQYVALYEALCADVAMPPEAGEHRDPRIDPDDHRGDTLETEIGNGPRRRVFSIDGGKPSE